MDNSLSFFRVFDLAFFAPGTLLFGVMWYTSCFPDAFSSYDDTVHGILTGAFAVVFIYVLGLICHGVQRAVLWIIWFMHGKPNKALPWYTNLKKDNPRNELSMYFWYMRSTCWNLVVAIILGNVLFCFSKEILPAFNIEVSVVIDIGVLMFLGCEYDKSLKKTVGYFRVAP